MTISRSSSNSTTADGTEQTLGSPTAAGRYWLLVDLINLANGDIVEFRAKMPALNAGTNRVVAGGYAAYQNAQSADNLLAVLGPFPVVDATTFTLKQTGGSNRVYPWAIVVEDNKADLVSILGTALTETSGLIAAGFKKFFNVTTPTGTVNSLPDAVAGASGGVFIAGSNAATSITTALTANITGNLSGSAGSVTGNVGGVASGGITSSSFAAGAINAAAIAADAIGASELASDAVAEIQSGLSTLSQADIRTAAGLASANLDTQLAAIAAKTTNLPSDPADASDIAALIGAINTIVSALPSAATIAAAVWGAASRTLSAFGFSVTVGTNSDKTGYSLSAAGIDAILDDPITEPSGVFSWGSATLRNIIGWLGALAGNKITQTSTLQTLRNDADDDDIATSAISDNGTTTTRAEWQ